MAHDLAFDIVDVLTSPVNELRRLDAGVGLPTSESYYAGQNKLFVACSGREIQLPRSVLDAVVNVNFERGNVENYCAISPHFAYTLERILISQCSGAEAETNLFSESYDELVRRVRLLEG